LRPASLAVLLDRRWVRCQNAAIIPALDLTMERKRKVLVVEDDVAARDFVVERFKLFGFIALPPNRARAG
jgi:hypothetical protein